MYLRKILIPLIYKLDKTILSAEFHAESIKKKYETGSFSEENSNE